MQIKIITIYPHIYDGFLSNGLVARAINKNLLSIHLINLRDFASDKFHHVDDYPYGGGNGMIISIEPLYKALNSIKTTQSHIILTSPVGKRYTQSIAETLSHKQELIFIAGYFEGVDARIEHFIDEQISIGDFILSNGDLAIMSIIDSITRLLPNALGNHNSLNEESFSNKLLEYPQYTRPKEFLGLSVPEVLLSGNHKKIERWRLAQSIKRTKKHRPDLYKKFREMMSQS